MRNSAIRRRILAAAGAAALLAAGGAGAAPAHAAWRAVQAEQMQGDRGVVRARYALRLDDGSAGIALLTRAVDRVAVRMRGRPCGGAPRVRVLVDDRVVLDRAATTRGWHRYEHRARIRPGRHALRVALANPFQRAPGCKRSASIDYVDLRERIPIGAAADWALSQDNATYRDTLLANFDSITPENAMKFAFLEPAPGQYDFSGADGLVALAENAGLAFHGHALVFDRQLPLWVQARLSWAPGEVHEMLRSYIDTVVGRYRGRIASWDVVNEPLAPDGSLSPTFFDRQLGPDYIAEALRLAHAADPAAKLYINEVGAEELNPKSDALYALVQRLLAQGVPLDGIGFQFHANIGAGAPRPDAIRANLQRFADLGLEIAMSEVDVRTSTGVGALVARLTQQADVYGEIAQACAAQPACVRFTTWGVLDPFSWLGPNELGLAFDDAGRPKPAWAAITSALR